jgi:ABC-2 type transport system ATP-binding protein
MQVIDVAEVSKVYVVREGSRWRGGKQREIRALKDFSVTLGTETLGVIGPNGAGKSTLVKLLTGLLPPTEGRIRVCGFDPWKQRRSLSRHIGVMLGHRSRLWYHLSALESLRLIGRMYEMDRRDVERRVEELTELFSAADFISQPGRSLSLGQRMRCEIMAALIHSPGLLLLDEPTVGLDILAKQELRDHLDRLGSTQNTAILLTSHDLADIEQLAQRVLILDNGRSIFGGSLNELMSGSVEEQQIHLQLVSPYRPVRLPGVSEVLREDRRVCLGVNVSLTPVHEVVAELLQVNAVADLKITEPPLEEVIAGFYRRHSAAGHPTTEGRS